MGVNGSRNGVYNVKKLVVNDKIPVQYIIPKTAAYATGAILTGHNFNAASTALTNDNLEAQPPYPRTLMVTANEVGTAGHNDVIKVTGEDQFGDYIEETFYIQATAAGTTAGSKAFGKIEGVEINSGQTDANTTVKCTDLGLGYTDTIGLPWPIASSADIVSYTYDGDYATTAVDALTFNGTYHTLKLPTNAASKTVSVIYKTKLQKD